MNSFSFKVAAPLFFLTLIFFFALPVQGQKPILLHSFEDFFLHQVFAEENFYYETNSEGHFHGFNLLNKRTFSGSLNGTVVPPNLEQLDKANNKAIFHNENRKIEEEYSSLFSFDSTGFTRLFDAGLDYTAFNAEGYAVIIDNNVYVTDGTQEGTIKIMDGPSLTSSRLGKLYPKNNSIYFFYRNAIHKTDGTKEGTKTIFTIPEDIYSASSHTLSISIEGEIFYTYKTNSNVFKTLKISTFDDSVKDFAEFNADVDELEKYKKYKEGKVAILGEKLLLLIYNKDKNWVIYGQENGEITLQWAAMLEGSQFVGYYNGKALFYSPEDFNTPFSILYETDGTFNGTKSITTKVHSSVLPVVHNDILYFVREVEKYGPELWKYNGTSVSLVDDILPGGKGIKIDKIHTYKNTFYFSGRNEKTNHYNIYRLPGKSEIVSVGVFADYNNNNKKDGNEHFLNNQHLYENNRQLHYYTGESIGQIGLEAGSHSFTLIPPTGWVLPSDFEPVEINIPEDQGKTYPFPLIPDSTYTEIAASLAPTPTRCGFETDFVLHYQNKGLTITKGEISIKPDSSYTFLSATPTPASTENGVLKWEVNELIPQQSGKIKLTFKMPDFESMGDVHSTAIITDFSDETGTYHHNDTSNFVSELTCSYDPNDIQVNPPGMGEQHLTLKEQELEYLIRFQNTGTDTAFNIVVRDTLSNFLDLESLEIVAGSHEMYTTLEDNVISFHFNDILLPDSTRDEPGSHGYILYRVKPKFGLPDSTLILNKASIYFDFNPPIITNTVFNTLVDTLPPGPKEEEDDVVTSATDDTIQEAVTIYPNPAKEHILIEWKNKIPQSRTYYLINNLGQKIMSANSSESLLRLNVSFLPEGLFFLLIQENNQRIVKQIVIE